MKSKILKVCGIRESISDYDWIDLLGFNFIDVSKRKISLEKAKSIETPMSVMRIWLFWKYDKFNKSWQRLSEKEIDEIIDIAREADMKGVQVYWVEDFSKFKRDWFYTICPVKHTEIVSSPIATIIWNLEEEDLESIDLLIIDSSSPGSWESYDYGRLWELKIRKPFLVAWWLDKESVQDIFKLVPNCIWVDIASGVDNWENVDEGMVKEILERM